MDDDSLIGSVRDDARRQAARAAAPVSTTTRVRYPGWTRRAPARLVRAASLHTWLLPAVRTFLRVRVHGGEHVRTLPWPVIFAANHQGHVDMPSVLLALPPRRRSQVAVAIAKEYFSDWFEPERAAVRARWRSGALYGLAALFFQGFPLPQKPPGLRQTLRFAGRLVDDGVSLLVFPEGRRTDAGELHPFRPGIGMLAVKLRLPVVPVRLVGSDRVWHRTWRRPRRGVVDVYIGSPRTFFDEEPGAVARALEDAVRRLGPPPPG